MEHSVKRVASRPFCSATRDGVLTGRKVCSYAAWTLKECIETLADEPAPGEETT